MNVYDDLSKEDLIKELKNRDQTISALLGKEKKNLVNQTNRLDNERNPTSHSNELNLNSIKRYSRQLILPEIGPRGQIKLLNSSVLIVGCGGLGCPAAIYLAAAGIGHLGLVDYDDVEISNLHRQILHTERTIGESKVNSVATALENLNSSVKCTVYNVSLSSKNIMNIIHKFDLILDCTDNVATRYLLNDACILSKKPLISGSALRFEGQLTIYGYKGGPCYRCLFPEPPPPETVTNCSNGGVLGVVPGIIGCMQALESIKVLVGIGEICSGTLLLFDASHLSFRSIKLRGRQQACKLCGSSPVIKTLIDYEQFCGTTASDKDHDLHLLPDSDRMSVSDLKNIQDEAKPHILIDVRTEVEVEICKLPGSCHIPLNQITSTISHTKIKSLAAEKNTKHIVCICKRGNDSQKATLNLREFFKGYTVFDVIGGLSAWSEQIDQLFPIY